MRILSLFALAVLLLPQALLAQSASPEGASNAQFGAWGFETQNLSAKVKPGDDFYQYANEGWLAKATIPRGFAVLDSFTVASIKTENQLDTLITELVAKPQARGTPQQQVAALFNSYMDSARLNALGLKPVQPELDRILAIRSRAQLVDAMARPFNPAIAAVGVGIDKKSPQRYALIVQQSGLALPSPEYYLDQSARFQDTRKAYLDYVADVFARAGIADGRRQAEDILALETEIARQFWSPTQTRDVNAMYRPMSPADLARWAPGFDWSRFLKAKGYGDQRRLVLGTDTAVRQLAALFARTPVPVWRSYLAFHYLNTWSEMLSEPWQQAHFDFFMTRLYGIKEQRPLRPRAIQFVSALHGEALGQAYVARYFPPEYKSQVQAMVDLLRASYRDHLERVSWMDAPTRAEALAKLAKIESQIGFPNRWTDYSRLEFRPDDLAGNVERLVAFELADERKKLGEARRDWEWPYSPQEINAGYLPSYNRIVFPAAILQPPFFDPNADPAVNFGSIGAIIGHEIGHAFDDQGSRSDGEGKLRNWWTDAAHKRFNERTAVLVSQFNGYTAIDAIKLNGQLTLGENIGDLGGLSIAYDAYRNYVANEQGGKAPMRDGFSGDQRFFLAWAQVWRNLATPDATRQRALTDPHSPGKFRTNGVVRNIDAWYEAFGVKPGDALYLPPENRVRIW